MHLLWRKGLWSGDEPYECTWFDWHFLGDE